MKKILEKISLLSLSLMLVSTFSASAALPQMIDFFKGQGIAASQVEFLFSVSSFAILGMLLITPWLSRWLSERTMIVAGLLLLSFGGSLPVFNQTFAVVFLSRIILGIGIGLINARAISILSETYSGTERVQMLGIRGSFEVLGNAVLTAICGFLLTSGWSHSFLIYLFGLPILVLYLLFAPKTSKVEASVEPHHSKKAHFTKGQLAMVLGLGALAGFVININSADSLRIPVVVSQQQLGTASQASLILSVMMLMGIVAGIFFGSLYQSLKAYLIPASLLMLTIGLLLLSFATNIWMITLGAMVSGFAYSSAVTLAFSLASEKLSSHLIGSATTIILVFCNLGGATSSIVLNLFAMINPSVNIAFLIYAVISFVLGMFILARLVWMKRR